MSSSAAATQLERNKPMEEVILNRSSKANRTQLARGSRMELKASGSESGAPYRNHNDGHRFTCREVHCKVINSVYCSTTFAEAQYLYCFNCALVV
jgi:hypothetical protein